MSASLRDSINNLGWSRREPQAASTSDQRTSLLGSIQALNPFSQGNVQLPIHEREAPGAPLPARSRQEEEEAWFALSRWDRILVFGALNAGALVLFVICFTLFPYLTLRPTKFATLWTVASALFLSSWAIMMGPMAYFRHLMSAERLPFTLAYFGSIALTLYFALGLRMTFPTLLAAIVQLVCLVWYLDVGSDHDVRQQPEKRRQIVGSEFCTHEIFSKATLELHDSPAIPHAFRKGLGEGRMDSALMTEAQSGRDDGHASHRHGPVLDSSTSTEGALYLIRFLQVHESFRKPELEALARLNGVNFEIVEYRDRSPFCIVRVASDAQAALLVRRSVLCTGIWALWGYAPTYEGLKSNILSSEATLVLLAKHRDSSFRFDIDCFQGKRSDASRRALMESLSYLPLHGRIAMRNPDVQFTIFEEYAQGSAVPMQQSLPLDISSQDTPTGSRLNKIPNRVFLGSLIGTSDRDAVTLYDLKRRAYISTTSMDANLALVTANLALAGPGKLAYDPFMGTGGFPLACAHFGAHVMGSDIDGRSVRGKGRKPGGKGVAAEKSVAGNFRQYGTHGRYLDGFIGDLTNTPLRVPGACGRGIEQQRWLDAVVCDPPYGVREGLKTLGSVKPGQGLEPVRLASGQMAHLAPDYIPPKRPYSFDALQLDILNFAVRTLVDGGRLCMWLPTANEPGPESESESDFRSECVSEPEPEPEPEADRTDKGTGRGATLRQTGPATADQADAATTGHQTRAASRRLPMHPGLRLVSVCAQDFNKWSRKLLTYERRSGEYQDVPLGTCSERDRSTRDPSIRDSPTRDLSRPEGDVCGSPTTVPEVRAEPPAVTDAQSAEGSGNVSADGGDQPGAGPRLPDPTRPRGRADELNAFRRQYFSGFK